METKTIPQTLRQMADEVDRLTEINSQQAKRIADLERINAKLYDNVERFVSRETINDFR